jgi:hypothetical protein
VAENLFLPVSVFGSESLVYGHAAFDFRAAPTSGMPV